MFLDTGTVISFGSSQLMTLLGTVIGWVISMIITWKGIKYFRQSMREFSESRGDSSAPDRWVTNDDNGVWDSKRKREVHLRTRPDWTGKKARAWRKREGGMIRARRGDFDT